MNKREAMIHSLGPEKISELLEMYDQMYEALEPIDLKAWESEKLYRNLQGSGGIEKMEDMIDIYEYVFEIEKSEKIRQWLDILHCTGALLEAKEILGLN